VGVDCADGQHQARGDLGVGQPFGKQPDDVGLPLGESGGIVSCGLDVAARDSGDPELSQSESYLAGQRLGAEGVEYGERRQQVRGLRALGDCDRVLVRAAGALPCLGRWPPVSLGQEDVGGAVALSDQAHKVPTSKPPGPQ
jgi:hypothetical protein